MLVEKVNDLFSIAFYNLENLFDVNHNEYTLDKDFTPDGEFQWNKDRYDLKINNISNAISKIGKEYSNLPPVFLGLAEVENDNVLDDLVQSENLKPYQYDFVHYESPDERGIDVAFLYQKENFELDYSDTYTLYLTDNEENRDYTRDILLISGKLFSEPVFIIINHWPSRTNGTKFTENKRIKAAQLVQKIVAEIYKEVSNPKIIIMGDFNDVPNSNSINNILVTPDFFNPMLELQQKNKGSILHNGKWFLFDQIIFSNNFLSDVNIQFKKAEVFDEYFLQEKHGKAKGAPLRTYLGKKYIGGYSDHFPVCAYLKAVE
ncbi:MAG: endonuclease/exonuclease/phosphatase family protein [Bacteroidota bacterium]